MESASMAHRRHYRWLALALLVACGTSNGSDGGTDTGTNPPAGGAPALTRSVVLQGLSGPWDIAVSADGAMFFTEHCRGLSVRRADGGISRLFGTSGSSLVAPDLTCIGQSGVSGVALDPAFATNRTVYVYVLSSLTSPHTNRVVRLVRRKSRFDLAQLGIAVQHVIDRAALHRRGLLRDVRDGPRGRQVDAAHVGRELVADRGEQARLAAAVGTDKTDLVARVYGEVRALEQTP